MTWNALAHYKRTKYAQMYFQECSHEGEYGICGKYLYVQPSFYVFLKKKSWYKSKLVRFWNDGTDQVFRKLGLDELLDCDAYLSRINFEPESNSEQSPKKLSFGWSVRQSDSDCNCTRVGERKSCDLQFDSPLDLQLNVRPGSQVDL
jgi:hypothetical protein